MGAATITGTFDGVVEWVEQTVAPELVYLKPADGYTLEGYSVEWVHPRVYSNFVPTDDLVDEGSRFPSIAVQMITGNDVRDTRSLNVRLVLCIWMPGHFEAGVCTPSMDGWRDTMNGLDVISKLVRSAETIAGARLDADKGISYGFLDQDGEVIDQYPFFMGRVDFTLEVGTPASKRFEKLL